MAICGRNEENSRVSAYFLAFLLHFGLAAYQYLIVQEISASVGHMAIQPLVAMLFALTTVAFGLGAATIHYRGAAIAWRSIDRKYLFAIGASICFSLLAILRLDMGSKVWASGLISFLTINSVFFLSGRAVSMLYAQTAADAKDQIGLLNFCALFGYVAGFLIAGFFNPRIGCNASLSVLGICLMLAGSKWRARIRLGIGLLLLCGLKFFPPDNFMEAWRIKHFGNLTLTERAAILEGRYWPVLESWSNVGKVSIYQLQDERHLFGTYNYFRVWDTNSDEPDVISRIIASLGGSKKTLFIGLGAGRQLVNMPDELLRNITGVEIDHAVTRFFLSHPEWNRWLFRKIGILTRDGRSLLDETEEKYDTIVFAGPHTATKVISNLMQLESYLITAEAMKRTMEILSPSGQIVYSSLGVEAGAIAGALRECGALVDVYAYRGSKRIAYNLETGDAGLSYWPRRFTIVASLDSSRLKKVEAVIGSRYWEKIAPLYYLDSYKDDGPQLWNFANVRALIQDPGSLGKNIFLDELQMRVFKWQWRICSILWLLILPVLGTAIAGIARMPNANPKSPMLVFCHIGAGFMVLQLLWLAKFRSFYGDPLSTAFVVNSIFLTSVALGSLASNQRWATIIDKLLALALISITLAYTLFLSNHIPFHLSNLLAKVLVGILIITPFSFIAGFFFPLGLLTISTERFGNAFLLDSLWAFFGLVLFMLTSNTLGVSYNFAWILLFYCAALADCNLSVTRGPVVP